MSENARIGSFYKYLLSNGYYFDKELIENYLLSLKVKPFEILTGNSGTGKTKLSQLFAHFISENVPNDSVQSYNKSNVNTCFHNVKVSTSARSWGFSKKYNKSGNECGWSVSSDYFIDVLPLNSILGTYEIEIGSFVTEAEIEFVPQIYYDKFNKEMIEYFKELYKQEEKQIKKDKELGVTHEKQMVDLGIDCNSLSSVISEDFIQKDEVVIDMTVSSFIARNRVVLSWDIFNYVPYKKSIPCKIIASDIESTATFYPKFRLANYLNEDIKNYLENILESAKSNWLDENKEELINLSEKDVEKKME